MTMYKHILTLALILMGAFLMWVRTYAAPAPSASSARTTLLIMALGFLAGAMSNHASKE